MSQGKGPDVDGLSALVAWSGLEVDRFVRNASFKEEPEPLAVISSCLYSDPRLSEKAGVALDQMVKSAYRNMTSQGSPGVWAYTCESVDATISDADFKVYSEAIGQHATTVVSRRSGLPCFGPIFPTRLPPIFSQRWKPCQPLAIT